MLFLSVIIACIVAVQCGSVEDSFKSHRVVPDVVPQAPNKLLKVTYHNRLVAEDGVVLTPTQVKNEPMVEYDANSGDYYALFMVDPDAPQFHEFKHWVVVNIPGNDVASGEVLAEYLGSGPPRYTGLHRYVFLLYKQQGKLYFDGARVNNRSRRNRPKFHVAEFAQHHQLGQAVAGTFFQAEYDDYVPILLHQLSEN